MIVVVTGGRNYQDDARVSDVLGAHHGATPVRLLLEGGATGADRLARKRAQSCGVQVSTYTADWAVHGRRAGPLRNELMLRSAVDFGKLWGMPVLVVAFPGGTGTAHCVRTADFMGLDIQRVP